MTVINLPPLPDGFNYTGEWRQPKPLEYYIDLEGDLTVAALVGPMGYHHIVSGPANLKVDYLGRRLREANSATWMNSAMKEDVVNALLASIDMAMRDG